MTSLPDKRDEHREHYATLASRHLDHATVEKWLGLLKPALFLIRVDDREDGGGPVIARVGGVPDLPVGVGWPRWGDDALSFVAEVDLTALHGAAPELPFQLPGSGRILFFHYEDLEDSGKYVRPATPGTVDHGTRVLLVPDDAECVTPEVPENAVVYDATARPGHLGLSYPTMNQHQVVAAFGEETTDFSGPWAGLEDDLLMSTATPGGDAIGGWARWPQSPGDIAAAAYLHPGVGDDELGWRAANLDLLLAVASDQDRKMTFGNLGTLHWFRERVADPHSPGRITIATG